MNQANLNDACDYIDKDVVDLITKKCYRMFDIKINRYNLCGGLFNHKKIYKS